MHDTVGEHDHDDFASFVVDIGPVSDPAAFRAGLAAAIREQDVVRVKGFVDVADRDRRLVVQAVGNRLEQHFDRPWAAGESRATRLVVIGKTGLDRAAVEAALTGAALVGATGGG
ncbi:MAG: GTP-binding protein [Alphaproteobacteria bacterium]